MIPAELKRTIFDNIPTEYTVNNNSITSIKTVGLFPFNTYNGTVVNLRFPLDMLPYYRSADEMYNIASEILTKSKVYRGTIRFMVGSNDITTNISEEHIYTTGTNIYTTIHNPILSVISLTADAITFVENVDYRIITNKSQIEWIGTTPNDSEIFTINYLYRERGYWIATEIAEYLAKWVELNFPTYLHEHGASIIDISSAIDLTDDIAIDNLNIITFDVDIRYTFEWSRALTDEEGPVMSGSVLTMSGSNYLEIHTIP